MQLQKANEERLLEEVRQQHEHLGSVGSRAVWTTQTLDKLGSVGSQALWARWTGLGPTAALVFLQGVLRQIPVVGSVLNWFSPVQASQKGRTFNLTAGRMAAHHQGPILSPKDAPHSLLGDPFLDLSHLSPAFCSFH